MNRTSSAFALVAALGLATAAVSAPHMAAAASERQQLAQAQAASYSDEKLQAYAIAFIEVEKISVEYRDKIRGVESDEERAKITEETSKEMTEKVEDTPGITVLEYNEITQASTQDQALAEKIYAYVDEEVKR